MGENERYLSIWFDKGGNLGIDINNLNLADMCYMFVKAIDHVIRNNNISITTRQVLEKTILAAEAIDIVGEENEDEVDITEEIVDEIKES